jgi:hypothetical protein
LRVITASVFYHDLLFDLQLCSTDQQTAAREWRSQRRMNLFLRHIALASVKRAWRPSAGRRRRVIRYPRSKTLTHASGLTLTLRTITFCCKHAPYDKLPHRSEVNADQSQIAISAVGSSSSDNNNSPSPQIQDVAHAHAMSRHSEFLKTKLSGISAKTLALGGKQYIRKRNEQKVAGIIECCLRRRDRC